MFISLSALTKTEIELPAINWSVHSQYNKQR